MLALLALCWTLYKGSGIYVNVKRTLVTRAPSSSMVRQFLSTLFAGYHSGTGCIPADRSRHCGDKYYCTVVLANGYDSLQLPNKNEVLICSDQCGTIAFNHSCTPLEIRTGYNASRPCHCNPGSFLINCGRTGLIDRLGEEETRSYLTVKDGRPNTYHPVVCVSSRQEHTVNGLISGSTRSFSLSMVVMLRVSMPSVISSWLAYDTSMARDNVLFFVIDSSHGGGGQQVELLFSSGDMNNQIHDLSYDSLQSVANFSSSSQSDTALNGIDLSQVDKSFTGYLQNSIINLVTHDIGSTKIGIIYINSFSYNEFSELVSKVRDQSLCMGLRGVVIVVLVYLMQSDERSSILHRKLNRLNSHLKHYVHFIHVSNGKLQTTSYHCNILNTSTEFDPTRVSEDLLPNNVITYPSHASNASIGSHHDVHVLQVKSIDRVLHIKTRAIHAGGL